MRGMGCRGRAFVALLGMLSFACGGEPAPEQAEVARPVKLITFGAGGTERSYEYPGRVFPNTEVLVAFEMSGRLEELPVTKGQEVEQGDLLARLDQRDFRNELAAARARSEEADATLGRYEAAGKSRAVSPFEVDQARARAREARAAVKVSEKAVEDSAVHAPFDGIVADRFVENFQNVDAKQPVLSLQDHSVFEIRVNIPERDAASPEAAGDGEIVATFDAVPGRQFEVEIKEFVTDADPVTQTFPVTLMLRAPEDAEILPGMTATVVWQPDASGSGDESWVAIPAVAVLGQAGREPWVWVVAADSMLVSRRTVEVGPLVDGDHIQILSGLEPGELVAASGAHHLADGMKVRPYGG